MDRSALKVGLMRRIDEALAAKGLAAATASRMAGKSVTFIRDLRTKPDVVPGIDSVAALADALDVSPSWLAFGSGDGATYRAASGTVPLVGIVSGGFWREIDAPADEPAPSPFAPDPRWPADRQFAVRVDGESINRVARHGDLLAVVAIEAVGRMPEDGALVIVEEARDGGSMIRTTAKRLRRRGDLHELHADSDDPRWRDVRLVIEPDVDDGRPTVTRVTGLVTAVHRRLA
jgi:SOS-response transcriptional repressor LexA